MKELDRLPPPWFPDRHIAKCQVRSVWVFGHGHVMCGSASPLGVHATFELMYAPTNAEPPLPNQMCAKSFNVFRRKHHCRRCGRCICASCAPDRCRKELPEFGYREKVRQCVDCYDLFAIW